MGTLTLFAETGGTSGPPTSDPFNDATHPRDVNVSNAANQYHSQIELLRGDNQIS